MSDDVRRDSQLPDREDLQHGRFPLAEVRTADATATAILKMSLWRYGWLIGVCLAIAVALVVSSWRLRGPEITIRFQRGHGLKPGDALRHRGIDVGEVVSVRLNGQFDGVDVKVSLERSAAGLARVGSRFWIERPRVNLSHVSGLETVVGAKFIAVLPGQVNSPAAADFQGVETPLSMMSTEDTEVAIRFADGHGLEVADEVKFRGIVVGEVTAVQLDERLGSINVIVRLVQSADRLARAGSQFWVERPKVSFSGIRGLETIVGGRYVAVIPGPPTAKPLTSFEGLDQGPNVIQGVEGGLEIVLEGVHRRGLEPGAPLMYRGLRVGQIVSVGLSTDAVAVEVRAYVDSAYKRLIRDNTRFWSNSGVDLQIGITGVQVDADTLATIAAGGAALATPDAPGDLVSTGHRFSFEKTPREEWLQWRPRIPIGSSLLPDGLSLPQPLRASLNWRSRRLGLTKSRQRQGWTLPLDDGRLIGPADLLAPVDDAVGQETILEVAGRRFAVTSEAATDIGRLRLFKPASPVADRERCWPTSRCRAPPGPEDCLLVAGPQDVHLPVSAGRITAADNHWLIDPSLSLNADWRGACVLSVRDGALVGLVLVDEGQARVALLPSKF